MVRLDCESSRRCAGKGVDIYCLACLVKPCQLSRRSIGLVITLSIVKSLVLSYQQCRQKSSRFGPSFWQLPFDMEYISRFLWDKIARYIAPITTVPIYWLFYLFYFIFVCSLESGFTFHSSSWKPRTTITLLSQPCPMLLDWRISHTELSIPWTWLTISHRRSACQLTPSIL